MPFSAEAVPDGPKAKSGFSKSAKKILIDNMVKSPNTLENEAIWIRRKRIYGKSTMH